MKSNSFITLFFIVLMIQSVSAQKITFKDENFKKALIDEGYDRNKDGEIDVSEIDTIAKLTITKKKIKSLDDLVWFKSLRSVNANSNEVHNLDVFFNNPVIEEIYVGDNPLGKKLTLKNVKKLNTLIAFADQLQEIDLTGCDNIRWLYLQQNHFETVDVKNLPKLETLQLMDNKSLKFLNIDVNQLITSLYVTGTAITELDVTHNPLLNILYIDNNVKLIKNKAQTNLNPMPLIKVQSVHRVN